MYLTYLDSVKGFAVEVVFIYDWVSQLYCVFVIVHGFFFNSPLSVGKSWLWFSSGSCLTRFDSILKHLHIYVQEHMLFNTMW